MSKVAIEAQGLEKRYPPARGQSEGVLAVAGIDLRINTGEVYALLGPNGAGKTTTINMLTTLTRPTAGTALVAGHDVIREAAQVRARIGVTFQDIVLDNDLTGRQVLDIHGRLYRQPGPLRRERIAQLVELVQLADALDRPVKSYSGGMKRRLELARGLMTDPQVLFLDEPTQGLDPQNRASVWSYIRELNRQRGLTLLLTTHYMEEAEALAHRVGIVDHGKLVVEGTLSELVAQIGAEMIRVRGSGDSEHFATLLRRLPFVERVQVDTSSKQVTVYVDHGGRRLAEVLGAAGGNGYQVEDITMTRPGLADVFLHYTGRALRDS
jgi:ABC-2 type transport system ATP-binding protein